MRILLAGSGKMARNVGFFLLRGGNDVAWVDRDHQWLLKMEKRIGKDRKRLASVDEQASPGEASFFLAGEPGIPECDVLLETIEEDVEAKRGIIAGLRDHLVDGGLVLTNSSSILPHALTSLQWIGKFCANTRRSFTTRNSTGRRCGHTRNFSTPESRRKTRGLTSATSWETSAWITCTITRRPCPNTRWQS